METHVKEAIDWLYEIAEEHIQPFEAWSSQDGESKGYHCWGCEGEFISRWPKWEEPTLKTFRHKKNCKYIHSLKALELLPTQN